MLTGRDELRFNGWSNFVENFVGNDRQFLQISRIFLNSLGIRTREEVFLRKKNETARSGETMKNEDFSSGVTSEL